MSDLLPEQIPPERTPARHLEASHSSNMYLNVTCWPPLGQSSLIPRAQHGVNFTVLLETAGSGTSGGQKQPKVSLWHNHGGQNDWTELQLSQVVDDENDTSLLLHRPQDHKLDRTWFTGVLPGMPKHGHLVSFTLKFVVDDAHGWRWAKDTQGIGDGALHYQAFDYGKHQTYDFVHWFEGISSDIHVSSEVAETDETCLYTLTCPVIPAKGENSGWQQHQLGIPRQSSKWFGLVRLWAPWLAPRQGGGKLALDKDAILLSFLRSDGLHVVLLALSGIDDLVTSLVNDEHGNIIVKGRNDRDVVGNATALVAIASSFEVANAAVFYHARKMVSNTTATPQDDQTRTLLDAIKPEWLEEWYDGLSYCTWNALGQNLTADKIFNALNELTEANINITNLIIDDNWQSLSKGDSQFSRGWSDFEANKDGFPNGMKATVAEIKRKHPNIRHIAVWHAMLGYWGGIDPHGSIAREYKTVQVEKEAGVAGGTFTVVAAEDARRMYDDFYAFLAAAGVDSVKTDAQFFLDLLLHAPDRKALIREYQDAWTTAHLRHLASRAISCMSQSPQMLFHSQLPTNKPRLLVRNSDDFFPEVPASHPWHVFCNAHNSLFTQHLNVLPDWDMFQTSHSWAAFHAAARCVSGGPIYFTDYPGKHDIDLIRQMTATTPRGNTVILRPHIVGKAMNPYNEYNAHALLKIGTYVGFAQTGTGILGIFNVSKQHLSEFVSLEEFPGTEMGEYVVSSFLSGAISLPMSRAQEKPAIVGIELNDEGWDILTAYALRSFQVGGRTIRVAMMGLLYKMTGAAAVTGYDVYVEENGRLRVWTSLKALGMLGLFVSDLPRRNVASDFMVMIHGQPIPAGCVKKCKLEQHVLEIDVEEAWRQNGDEPQWSNEVTLEIFMH